MLEIALAGLFVAVAVVAIGRRGHGPVLTTMVDLAARSDGDSGPDLPCPWCMAQTAEDDRSCPSCGQRFG